MNFDFILKIIQRLGFGDPTTSLTNSDLLEQLTGHFKRQLSVHSVRRRMLYPMSFYIFIHPDDWTRSKDDLQFIIDEIIDEFYKVIYDNLVKHPNYTPPATEWFFQFSELAGGTVMTDTGQTLQLGSPGMIYVMSNLLAPKIFRRNGVTVEENYTFSLSVKDSDIDATVNINPQAIASIDRFGQGVITHKFDMTLGGRNSKPLEAPPARNVNAEVKPDETIPWAELSWKIGSKTFHYTLNNKYVIISGPDETKSGPNILKIDVPGIQTPHLKIQWDKVKQKYLLRPYAETILNEQQLVVSQNMTVKEYEMARRSSIDFPNMLKIDFDYSGKK